MAKKTPTSSSGNSGQTYDHFYRELESSLASASGPQLKKWAAAIIDEHISLVTLAPLLLRDDKTAMRFQWMVSEIGISDPEKLHADLAPLFLFMMIHCPARLPAFASWWHYAGVPEENDAGAIDLLFGWVLSAETNVTTRSRALWVLMKLTKKYPELKQELKTCVVDQMDKYSSDFRKRAEKILSQLGE